MAKVQKPWYEDKTFLYTTITGWYPSHKITPSGQRGWRETTFMLQCRTDRIDWFFRGRYMSFQEACDAIHKSWTKGSPYFFRVVEEWYHRDESRVERHYPSFLLLRSPPPPPPKPKPKKRPRPKIHVWDVLWRRVGEEWTTYGSYFNRKIAYGHYNELVDQWSGLPYEIKIHYRREKRRGKEKQRGGNQPSSAV